MSEICEYSLPVPAELVTKTNGLAIDIGGSVAKFIYRNADNLKDVESERDEPESHLQLVSFPRAKLTDALEYVKQRAQITRHGNGDLPEIATTGFGCTQFGKTICESLQIRTKSIVEFDCFVKAFVYLASKLSRKDLLELRDKIAASEGEKDAKAMADAFSQMHQNHEMSSFKDNTFDFISNASVFETQTSPDGPLEKCENIYPCILVVIGSGTAYMQINEDKSCEVLEVTNRGGIYFQGIGSLLTGVKDFSELLELAARGDKYKVGLYPSDFHIADGAADSDHSPYRDAADHLPRILAYSFGKVSEAYREEKLLQPEDLAIAWLNDFVMSIADFVNVLSHSTGIRRLFFSGSFCSHPLIRSIMTKELTARICRKNIFGSRKVGHVEFDFLKPGGHMGALGALIFQFESLSK